VLIYKLDSQANFSLVVVEQILTVPFVGNMIQSRKNLGTGCCAGDLKLYGEVY
jgi:hypothetical protein